MKTLGMGAEETAGFAISAFGMVCSLGHDAANACAAARSGVQRPQPLDYFRVRSPYDGKTETIVGHPVPILTVGFETRARLLRLLAAGLTDLKASIGIAPLEDAKVYLSVPDPGRVETGLDLIQYEATRRQRIHLAAVSSPPTVTQEYGHELVGDAAEVAGFRTRPSTRIFYSGHTGVSEGLDVACHELSAGAVPAAIVGGVDSLLDEDTLTWLHNAGRLKTRALPAGLQPGEGCALLYLDRRLTAPSQKRIATVVMGVRDAAEPAALLSGEPPVGTALADAIAGVAALLSSDSSEKPWLVTDQNGETYRALEWGNAACRLAARNSVVSGAPLWYPAASFGDTGSASGAIAMCVAACALERGYAPSRMALVTSSGDGSQRAAVALSAVMN